VMTRRILAASIAVFAAVAAVAADGVPADGREQAAKPGPPVRIEFRALNDDGQIVADLKAADLSLKVNGKAREIQSISLYRATADAPAGTPLPPPYSTNITGQHGRVLHVLIDDDSISPGREGQIKEAIRTLTAELSPADRIGVLNTTGSINVSPGSDFTKVRMAVDGFAGDGRLGG